MVEKGGSNQVHSMVNENDMNPKYIEDNHIVDRYLLNQLSKEEACAFENYYFAHPEMLEELKIAKSMQETVRQQSDKLQAVKNLQNRSSWFELLFRPQIGFALSAALGLGLVVLLAENNRLKSAETIVYQVPSLTFSQTRSGNADMPKMRITQNQTAIVVRLELGPIGYPKVHLELQDSSDDVLWSQISKIDAPLGSVNLVLATRQMKAGVYYLNVYPPTGGNSTLSSYSFELDIN